MPLTTRRFLFSSALIALFAGLLLTPGLPGEFVFDDIPNIVNNSSIQLDSLSPAKLLATATTPQASGQMRGFPTLTFAVDYWRGGGANPATFKTTNILIHALTAFALAWLFRSLLLTAGTDERHVFWIAPALAMAWAAHPLLVSSVLYAVQRLQTLGTLFLVLALTAYLQGRRAQIAGSSGRTAMLGALMLWALAMGCKEDSALLPAYTLAMELTVLRFRSADAGFSHRLRRGYQMATIAATALYLFVVVPHYWNWGSYDGRNFSTIERLMTEARVLWLYLWQIAVPLPSHMPFYYDWLQPSRGLLQPWSTLPAILGLLALAALAWRQRTRWPLFSLGVFLFLGAHFIAANVIGLELAFEHRNHFALIGAVLAIGSLLGQLGQRIAPRPTSQAIVASALLLSLGTATLMRAHSWRDNLHLARAATEAAPHSARAWVQVCAEYLKAGGGPVQTNSRLDNAITACRNGDTLAPYALNNSALLMVLKTLKGNIKTDDWNLFQHRLETVEMSWDNQRAPMILTYHYTLGVPLDKAQLLKAVETLDRRAPLKPSRIAEIGYFVMNDLDEPEAAMPYFIKAIEQSPSNDPFAQRLYQELQSKRRPDLAEQIVKAATARLIE